MGGSRSLTPLKRQNTAPLAPLRASQTHTWPARVDEDEGLSEGDVRVRLVVAVMERDAEAMRELEAAGDDVEVGDRVVVGVEVIDRK